MWALALLMKLGPHKDRGKLWPGWELSPRPSDFITAALRSSYKVELQGQTQVDRGKWRCQLHGNEYVEEQGRVTFYCKRWKWDWVRHKTYLCLRAWSLLFHTETSLCSCAFPTCRSTFNLSKGAVAVLETSRNKRKIQKKYYSMTIFKTDTIQIGWESVCKK